MAPSPSPSESSIAPDPEPAPQKRKITASARVRENTDPLLARNKKARTETCTKAKQKVPLVRPSTLNTEPVCRQEEVGEVPNKNGEGATLHPKDASDILGQAEVIAIDADVDPTDATMISDSGSEPEAAEESCEAELSKNHIGEMFQKILTYHRSPIQRVDVSHLRVLPRNSYCQIYCWASCSCLPMPC